MSCSFVIFIGSWILPLGSLELLGLPRADKTERYKRRCGANDGRLNAVPHGGDALAEAVREGPLLQEQQAAADHMPHP